VCDQFATECYAVSMRAINQRELRNNNAQVIRDVIAGESFTVLRDGEPVANLTPFAGSNSGIGRPATAELWELPIERVKISESTAAILDGIRGE